jgi:preprotein translocase subunit SecE
MATQSQAKLNPIQKIQVFFEEVRTELDKVTWPSYEDLKVSTKVCLYMLGIMVAITFLFDQVFNRVVLGLLSLAG